MLAVMVIPIPLVYNFVVIKKKLNDGIMNYPLYHTNIIEATGEN